MATLAIPADAQAQDVIPVRGGQVLVPAYDPYDHRDSATCQLALNTALRDLARQLAAIPFPPPGEPGYTEWALVIDRERKRINALRPVCLRIWAP